MRARPSFDVLLVTPEGVDHGALARVVVRGASVLGPRLALQARAKASLAARADVVARVGELARRYRIPWFVNGDPDAAVRERAHLHVPGDLAREGLRYKMQDAWISGAAHDDAEVDAALDARFDLVLVSPVFGVPGKGTPRGTAAIARAKARAPGLFVVALGGVDRTRARECFLAGADAVAVMRAPFEDPGFFEAIARVRET